MKNILLVDTNYGFTGDVESRMILDGIDGVDEIITRNNVNSIHDDIARIKPDELIISGNLINSHPNWNFGIPVKTYARSKEEILLSFNKGFECYGIINTAKELLDAIRNNRIVKQEVQPSSVSNETGHTEANYNAGNHMNPEYVQTPHQDILNQSQQYANEQTYYKGEGQTPYLREEEQNYPQQPAGKQMWICQCGAMNSGNFCQVCGKPRPVAAPIHVHPEKAAIPDNGLAGQNHYSETAYSGKQNTAMSMQGQQEYASENRRYQDYRQSAYQDAQGGQQFGQQMQNPMYNQPVQAERRGSYQPVGRMYQDLPGYSDQMQGQAYSPTVPVQEVPVSPSLAQNDLRSRIQAAKERDNVKNQAMNGPSSEFIEAAVNRDMGKYRKPAKVVTVYSAKGGVGKTTLSCEIATYLSLTSNGRENFKVCIADFNIDFGDVNNTLSYSEDGACMTLWAADIRSRIRSGERAEDIHYSEAEISKFLQYKAYDGQKDSNIGLSALLAPLTNEDSMDIEEDEIKVMLDNLVSNGGFDFVICDTGNNTRDSSIIPLDMADVIILVLTQSVNTVTCNMGFISTMDKIGFDLSKVKLVINQVQPSKSVGVAVEEIVETVINPRTNRPFEVLSYIKASNDVKSAENLGEPLVFNSSHEFSKSIGEITSKLVDKEFVLQKPKKVGFFRRLFGKKSQ